MQEPLEHRGGLLPADAEAAVVLQPRDRAFDLPTAYISSQGSAVLSLVLGLTVHAVGGDRFDALHGRLYSITGLWQSNRDETNRSGELVERATYTAYGQRTLYRRRENNNGPVGPASGGSGSGGGELLYTAAPAPQLTNGLPLNPFGFQGLQHNATAPTVHNRARLLVTQFPNGTPGRFAQRDPWMTKEIAPTPGDSYPDGMNSYLAYHAMSFEYDPSGKRTWTQWWVEKIPIYGAFECSKRIYNETSGMSAPSGYIGGHDKWRHCMASCMISKQCFAPGAASAKTYMVGVIWEYIQFGNKIGNKPLHDLPVEYLRGLADVLANSAGIACAGATSFAGTNGCRCCCNLGVMP